MAFSLSLVVLITTRFRFTAARGALGVSHLLGAHPPNGVSHDTHSLSQSYEPQSDPLCHDQKIQRGCQKGVKTPPDRCSDSRQAGVGVRMREGKLKLGEGDFQNGVNEAL